MNRRGALASAGATLAGLIAKPGAAATTPWSGGAVSLLRLLAAPETYDGRLVRVVGFAHLEYEGDALFLHREDFDRMIHTNSVGLSLTRAQSLQWRDLSDRYVGVEARFKATTPGTREFRAGRLSEIARFEYHPSREEFLAALPRQRP